MAAIKVKCPYCGSEEVSLYGKNSSGRERYLCRNEGCRHKTFQMEYKNQACRPGVKEKIAEMVMNGSGTRDTGRVLKISPISFVLFLTCQLFYDITVILCVGMFVVGQALFETGMANKIGGLVTRFAKNERILITAIMVIVGVMSGFLSNTGTAAVLISVVCGIADESGYSRGKLLMPLVFAAALGGNLSIIGAPGNLMGINALNDLGIQTGFFEYIPVGAPMLLIGILYFVFIGYRFLPDTKGEGSTKSEGNFSDVPRWKQITSLVVLVVVILAMIFED